MKFISTLLGLSLMVAVFAVSASAATTPQEFNTESKSQLELPACTAGTLVVNVTHGVTGDIDSGFGGYWAHDTYTRDLRVYQHANGLYCVTAKYRGDFDAVVGKTSPGTGYVLDGDEDGVFKGGYWGKLRGTLKTTPDYPVTGNIGSFDYGCDIDTTACSNTFSWLGAYFEPGYVFDYGWWGWLYLSPNHGWWINGSTGSAGDIH